MSAVIVGKDHIDLMVSAYISSAHSDETPKTQTRLGDKFGTDLVVQNYESWNHCHPEDTRTNVEYRWTPVVEYMDAYEDNDVIPGHYMVQVIKAIQYYECQSSEHPEWDESWAHAVCKAVRNALAQTGLETYLEWPKDEQPEGGGRLTWRGWNLAASHWTREHGFKAPPADDFEAIVEMLKPDPWGEL